MRALLVPFLATLSLAAQLPPSLNSPDPQVNPDRTVAFHFADPTATKVGLQLDALAGPLAMTQTTPGQWTVTTAPLAPEWYSYQFLVDGRNELDPHNVTIKASYTASANGFLVPGAPAKPWEETAIAHGAVTKYTYTTKVVQGLDQDQADYYVYTPPGYDARGKVKYPVLYLLHGWSDTAAGWSTIGKANSILDTLITEGKAKPMIVVMPLGYGEISFVRNGFSVWRDPDAIRRNVTGFGKALLTEVMPAVERDYLVSSRREDRAIAGLSMGGLEALTIGIKHAETFAWVGGFSSAVSVLPADYFASVDAKKADLKLLWISCGTEDELIKANRPMEAALKTEGFPVTVYEEPGRHEWKVWRDSLVLFAPLLFQK